MKLGRKDWEKSRDKWREIVACTKRGDNFVHMDGFKYLKVWDTCSYCEAINPNTRGCALCSLHEDRWNDIMPICGNSVNITSAVGEYVRTMRTLRHGEDDQGRNYAVEAAEAVLEAIEGKEGVEIV